MTGVTPVKKVPLHLQSAQNRLLIKNGTVVNDDGTDDVDIYVEDCQIKQMGKHLIIPGGTRVIDASGKLVLPGGLDANVHLHRPHRDLTQTVDDFYQGTRAALCDGTTCVIDCVEPRPGESLVEAYQKWRGWAEDKACCDYGLRVAVPEVTEAAKQEMEELTKEEYGVNAFHFSLSGEQRLLSDRDLLDAFDACKKMGALAQVHAESGEIVAREEKELLERGVVGPEGFALAHSEMAEEEATMRASTLAGQVHCPLYVGPVMSSAATDVLRRKKSRGNVVFGETGPAALACEGENYWNTCWRHAAGFVCAPPIRRGQTAEMLSAVAHEQNGVDVLASNHATFNTSQKALGKRDFTQIPVGINGAESRMSVLWETAVHTGKIDLTRFVALTSTIPAKIFNLYPAKGRVAVGSEADIVIWDPKATKIISAKDHQLKVDFNVFEGMTCHGAADTVIQQGRVVVDQGQLRIMQGFGKFVPLAPFSPFVYDMVKAKQEQDDAPRQGVVRSAEEMASINGCGDIPPPTPPKSTQAEPAASQHESSLDLSSHPETPDFDAVRQSPQRASVRVRAPPGGRSTGGFW